MKVLHVKNCHPFDLIMRISIDNVVVNKLI